MPFNASPDRRQQIIANPALHPAGKRGSPIDAVFLTNGDVDHVAGLLTLRESQDVTLYGTDATPGLVALDTVFGVLDPVYVRRTTVSLNHSVQPGSASG